jgi:hypothetical protein
MLTHHGAIYRLGAAARKSAAAAMQRSEGRHELKLRT